jgi:pimeloyl-ACP methyl ester carboxylesterase
MVSRRTGILAGVAGAVAATAAVGLAAERYAVGRIRHAPDPAAGEPFGQLPADRTRTVTADDGVALHVEEVGPADAPLTVVFVHGYALALGSWHYQRRDLERSGYRLVFYDQRSHGGSARGATEHADIDHLGQDLDTVLTELVPTGPVALVGHSMGGMTVMALAAARPEYFGDRIRAVALLSTSTGRLAEITLGLPAVLAKARAPVLPLLLRGIRTRPALVERSRRIGGDLAWVLTRKYSFGGTDVSPALVDYVGQLIAATPIEVIADFYPALTRHDKLAAIGVLAKVEALLVVGDKDLLTPVEHSVAMAEVLPDAELLVIPGAGHLAMMERPDLINPRLRHLLREVAP